MKMWVCFEKGDRLRHVGHLDLMRAMQRALRRSALPVRYSQGFNPHILLTFAAPLSVGMEGRREVMEVQLDRPVPCGDFLEILNAALPGDLRCLHCRPVDDGHPAPMALLAAAEYEITPLEPCGGLLEAVPGFLKRQTIPALRKTKTGERPCDLRPWIYNLLVRGEGLRAVLALRESGTCKPDLLLSSLAGHAGVPVPRCRITRTRLYTEGFAPLEDA